jgi:hypothetical protein
MPACAASRQPMLCWLARLRASQCFGAQHAAGVPPKPPCHTSGPPPVCTARPPLRAPLPRSRRPGSGSPPSSPPCCPSCPSSAPKRSQTRSGASRACAPRRPPCGLTPQSNAASRCCRFRGHRSCQPRWWRWRPSVTARHSAGLTGGFAPAQQTGPSRAVIVYACLLFGAGCCLFKLPLRLPPIAAVAEHVGRLAAGSDAGSQCLTRRPGPDAIGVPACASRPDRTVVQICPAPAVRFAATVLPHLPSVCGARRPSPPNLPKGFLRSPSRACRPCCRTS